MRLFFYITVVTGIQRVQVSIIELNKTFSQQMVFLSLFDFQIDVILLNTCLYSE